MNKPKKTEGGNKCQHEWRQLIQPWTFQTNYGGTVNNDWFYCIKCLKLQSK